VTIPARLKKLEARQARLEEKLDAEVEGIDEDPAAIETRLQELERWRSDVDRLVQNASKNGQQE
jgi:hypothetical protein